MVLTFFASAAVSISHSGFGSARTGATAKPIPTSARTQRDMSFPSARTRQPVYHARRLCEVDRSRLLPRSAAIQYQSTMPTFRKLLELIRFSHTIFALPFALLAAALAWKDEPFRWLDA